MLRTQHQMSAPAVGDQAGPTAELKGSADREDSCGRGGCSIRGVNGAERWSAPQSCTPRTSRLKPGFYLGIRRAW